MSDETQVFKNKKRTAVLFCAALITAATFAYEIYLPHSAVRGPREVAIAKGMGSRTIGDVLKHEGVIRSKWAFVLFVFLRGEAADLKQGVYIFGRHSVAEVADMLVAGGKSEKEITVPEGWTAQDIGRYLERQEVGTTEEWDRLISPAGARAFAERFVFLAGNPPSAGLEGYLFPDTYRLPDDAVRENAVVRMLDNFDRKLTPDLRAEIARREKTLFGIITMASLIEKEVVSDEDRALVSGILWERLAAEMPLQVDATIAYAKSQITNHKLQTNGKISLEDTKIDSPYNTYKYRGLPPGPIANPGMSAIRAAIYPKPSPYLYYLSAPDGRTIFSKTLDEHNAAKAKHLR